MILKRIKRKLYKSLHPIMGEIWMLHRVVEQRSERPEQRELEVTSDWLEQKILEYKSKGYIFISIDNLASLITHHSSFTTKKYGCITFDDGYQDNYRLAYPLLKRLGVPFTVYVTSGIIDNKSPMWWYPGQNLGLSTGELRILDADPLCTIGAHTVSHPKLDNFPYEEQYKEIADSKRTLESILGHEVNHFSFPHGAYNADSLAICQELGFRTIVQSWGGPVRWGTSPQPLPRVNLVES